MRPAIYILTNELETVLYIGVTSNLGQRIRAHRAGLFEGFSKRYNLHKLIYWEPHATMQSAIAREKQLKSWSRSRKEKLIESLNPYHKELMEEND